MKLLYYTFYMSSCIANRIMLLSKANFDLLVYFVLYDSQGQ